MNENSSILWHKRLGHIAREMMKRLMKDGILVSLDFSNLNIEVECIKGKTLRLIKMVPQGLLNC